MASNSVSAKSRSQTNTGYMCSVPQRVGLNTCIQHWFGFPDFDETLLGATFDLSVSRAAGITIKHSLTQGLGLAGDLIKMLKMHPKYGEW